MSDQPTGVNPPSYQPPTTTNVFGTKIPSAVTFAVAVLLFLLPFAELKCKTPEQRQDSLFKLNNIGMSFTNTGLGLALGSEWKTNMPNSRFFDSDRREDGWKKDMKSPEPNSWAIVALVLAVAGLGISFTKARAWAAVGAAAGALSAAALIGLMLDLQKQSKDLVSETQRAGNSLTVTEGSGFILYFTPWFFVAVVALVVASFFSYKRMQLTRQ